ncbi:MAG: AAA family ATPase [Deltaproteobacteria bacterium]|nr:AAA family ATPase [Deltaproteobacteria bacterium]MCL5791832.1 AAA family ATPase [Deltaproteobacteria bacterium]
MIIKEFVLQGIKKFKEPIKFQLHNGFNVFWGNNEKGKTTIADALFLILTCTSDNERRLKLKSYDSADSRLGIIFAEGPDTYRMLMDIVSGAMLLSKYNRNTEKYDAISKDERDIKDFFKREMLFKPLDEYNSLFHVNPYTLLNPYTTDDALAPAAATDPVRYDSFTLNDIGKSGSEQLGDFEPTSYSETQTMQQNNMSKEEILSQIKKLEAELSSASNISANEDRIQQFESQLSDVQEKLKAIKSAEAELRSMERGIEENKKFAELPEDIGQKIEDYIQLENKVKKDIGNIDRQKNQYTAMNVTMQPFYKGKLFIAGGAVVGLFVLTPVILSFVLDASWTGYLSIGIFAGFVMMGYALWNDSVKRSVVNMEKDRLSELEKRLQELNKKYEIESSVIKSIVKSLNLESVTALKENIKSYKAVLVQYKRVKEKYDNMLSEYSEASLQSQEEKIKSEISSIQEQVRISGGAGIDPYAISQQINDLKAGLASFEGSPSQKKERVIFEEKPVKPPDRAVKTSMPLYIKNIEIISQLTDEPPERITAIAVSKASSYLNKLTNNYFQEIAFKEGKMISVDNKGREIDFEQLSDSSKLKALFAVFLSITDIAADKWQWPVIMDEPFMLFDDNNRSTIYDILKSFSKQTQLMLFTSDNKAKPMADNFISL